MCTGLKQQHSASDDTIGPNEEEGSQNYLLLAIKIASMVQDE